MSLGINNTESFNKLMTKLVDNLPFDTEKRMSISDFGKLLFAEGTNQRTPSLRSANPSEEEQQAAKRSGTGSQSHDSKASHAKRVQKIKEYSSQETLLSQKAVRKFANAKEKAVPQRWTQEEDDQLRIAVARYGERNWKSIAEEVQGRNHTQCLQRWTKVLAPGLIKGHWRPDEDQLLKVLVAEGKKNWGQVASRIPGRTSKQCRERWYNHLDPTIVRGEYSLEEDRCIIETQARLGNRWSAIAAMLPGRTEDAVKIRYKSLCRVKKRYERRYLAESSIPMALSFSEHREKAHPSDKCIANNGALMNTPSVNRVCAGYERPNTIRCESEFALETTPYRSSMANLSPNVHVNSTPVHPYSMQHGMHRYPMQNVVTSRYPHADSAYQPTHMAPAVDDDVFVQTAFGMRAGLEASKAPIYSNRYASPATQPNHADGAPTLAYSLNHRSDPTHYTVDSSNSEYNQARYPATYHDNSSLESMKSHQELAVSKIYEPLPSAPGKIEYAIEYPAPHGYLATFSTVAAERQHLPPFAASQSRPTHFSSNFSADKAPASNPVAAFLQKQQRQLKNTQEQFSGSSTSQSGPQRQATQTMHTPAFAFAQRLQQQQQQQHQTGEHVSETRSPVSEIMDRDDNSEPAWKKVRPRTSIEAARSSFSRRLRGSGNGNGLIGRGSLDLFLNEIGDIGRISDLKMEEFQAMEVWRVSDDMSRLSL